MTKKNGGKIVIINLQETRMDKNADLVINCKLDLVFQMLFEKYLNKVISIPNEIAINLKLIEDEEIESLEALDSRLDVSNFVIDQFYLNKKLKQEEIETCMKPTSFKREVLDSECLIGDQTKRLKQENLEYN
jgi:hypothetical protein